MGEINQKLKVSVVIPVYNVELYLREAVDSVINQTLKDIEIILVNDGSTDNSLEIAREYKKIDNRIIVINQENKGLSGARNSGLEIAKGKYIYFMDSDDYIDLDTLELCYEKSEKERLDFVCFDAEPFSIEKLCINQFDYNRSKVIEIDKIFEGKKLLSNLLQANKYRPASVLNFINLNYLKKVNLKFYPKIIHEDELFTFILFLKAKRVSYINRKFFKRRVRLGSIMTISKGEKNLVGYLTVARELNKILLKEQDEEKIKLLKFQINQMVGEVSGLISLLNKDFKNKYKQDLKIEFKDYICFKNKIKLDYPVIFKVLRKIKKIIA